MLRCLNLFLFLVCISPCFFASSSQAKQLTILYAAELPLLKNEPAGSYANLATAVTKLRASHHPNLFIFGGGSLAPSMLSSFDRGAHIIDILNSIEPDVMGIAKREFSYFEDELSLRAYEAAFPMVLSNVTDPLTQGDLDGTEGDVLIEKDGVKVGVLAVVDQTASEEYLLQRLIINDPIASIVTRAEALRDQGATLIILMIATDNPAIIKLLNASKVDLVLRTDPNYTPPKEPSALPPENYITVASIATAALITIDWQENGSPPSFVATSKQVPLSQYSEDPAVAAQINDYESRMTALLSERLTRLTSKMDTSRTAVRTGENGFGNLVSDALREASHSDVALINGGAIRGDRTYKSGYVLTREDISSEIPFRNHIRVLKIKGVDIKSALENGVSRFNEESGRFPHVSGMSFTVKTAAQPGQRVSNIFINGEPLADNATYSLATSDYLADGGDGYDSLKRGIEIPFSQQVTPLIADIVISVLRRQPELATGPSGRITVIAGQER